MNLACTKGWAFQCAKSLRENLRSTLRSTSLDQSCCTVVELSTILVHDTPIDLSARQLKPLSLIPAIQTTSTGCSTMSVSWGRSSSALHASAPRFFSITCLCRLSRFRRVCFTHKGLEDWFMIDCSHRSRTKTSHCLERRCDLSRLQYDFPLLRL